MKNAYPRKLRFVDDPIDPLLIPDECRDEYGVDAVKLVRHLAWLLSQERGLTAVLMVEKQRQERLILGVPGECDG